MTRERQILEVLAAANRELYGLDLVAAGVKRRVLYVVLARMEESGLIEGREEAKEGPDRLPRRLYRITDRGRSVLLPPARVIP